jgi:hypothetical protein
MELQIFVPSLNPSLINLQILFGPQKANKGS